MQSIEIVEKYLESVNKNIAMLEEWVNDGDYGHSSDLTFNKGMQLAYQGVLDILYKEFNQKRGL